MPAPILPSGLARRRFLALGPALPVLGAAGLAEAGTDPQLPLHFSGRTEFTGWIAQGGSAPEGAMTVAGGTWYRSVPGATAIPDAPGWLPGLAQAQLSCWADTTAGHQAAWDWSHERDGAPLLLDYDLRIRGTEYWGNLTLIDAGGSISSPADRDFAISAGAGPWGDEACVLTRSANLNTDYGDPLETRYRMQIGSPTRPIRWIFDKSDPAKPSFPIRFVGLRDFCVALELSGSVSNPKGARLEHGPPDFYFFNQDGHIFLRSTLHNAEATHGGLWIRDINLGQRGPAFATRNLTLDIEAYDETGDETVAIFTTFSGRYRYVAEAGQARFSGPDKRGKTPQLHPAQRLVVRRNGTLLEPERDYALDPGPDRLILATPAAEGDEIVLLAATPGYLKNIRGRVVAHSAKGLAFNVINNAEMPPEWLSGHLDVFAISDAAQPNQPVFATRAPTDFTYGKVHVDINGAEAGAQQVFGAYFKQTGSGALPPQPVRVNDLIVRINGVLACGDGVVDMVYGGVDADNVVTCTSGSLPATAMKNNLNGRMRGGDLCSGTEHCVFRVREITGGTLRGPIGNSNLVGKAVTVLWDTDRWPSIYRLSAVDPGFAHHGHYMLSAHILAAGRAAPGRVVDSASLTRPVILDYILDHSAAGARPGPDRLARPAVQQRVLRIDGPQSQVLDPTKD